MTTRIQRYHPLMSQNRTNVELVLDYHQQSKHHLQRYARSLGYMDWANQPNPFRFFEGAERLPLPLKQQSDNPSYDTLFGPRRLESKRFDIPSLAGFLELSLGLSAWKQYGASEWSLRMNPSSGNLHPTECYLLLPETKGLPSCIAHYNPFLHSLEIRREFDEETSKALGALNGFGLILSSIFWREAWKYGERAFRYTQHDIGHALGALRFSATLQGWRMALRSEPASALLDRLLGFEEERQPEGELERADCFCWISGSDPWRTDVLSWLKSLGSPRFSDSPNPLSPDHTDWPVIEQMARLTESPGYTAHPQEPGSSQPRPVSTQSAETIIRRRRSAQAYDPDASHISFTAFSQLLATTLPSVGTPFDLLPHSPQLHLMLFVHRVDDLSPGLYCLVRHAEALPLLRRHCHSEFSWRQVAGELPLYLLQAGDCRSLARTISCHQDIAGDSAFSLGMLARFEPLLREAPWQYPRLFWEAGLIGQALYLEAEAQGLRGTGIGCYFDDLMHELLGLQDRTWQDLYHFTVGAPREDSRLQTRSPYHHLPRLRAAGEI
jgi:SagB-type dehydrogenase family enzyme